MKTSLFTALLIVSFSVHSFCQSNRLPAKPEPGICYIRATTPPVVEIYEVTYPVYTGGEIDPAELETITIETEPAFANWEYRQSLENCQSSDPRDCMVLCYIEHPAVTKEITIVKNEALKNYYEYQTFEIKEINDLGGVAYWEKIECKLLDYNELPIFFENDRAELTAENKEIIESHEIMALLKAMPAIKVEISSHTDSRGDAQYNKELSQQRAEAVADHLISNGIESSRLMAIGYGESRLKNNCKDGKKCTERKHLENVRTEFRVLSN